MVAHIAVHELRFVDSSLLHQRNSFVLFVAGHHLRQPFRQFFLDRGQVLARGELFVHRKNLLSRRQSSVFRRLEHKLFWLAVAFKTPCHSEGVTLPGHFHLIDGTVTVVAAYTSRNVNTVIEIDEVRDRVDLVPLQRCVGFPAFANWLKQRTICPDLRVASHTNVSCRDRSGGSLFDRPVAEATINSQLRHVVLVTEWRRLRDRYIHLGVVWRSRDLRASKEDRKRGQRASKQAGGCNRIRGWFKKLSHSLVP